MRSIEASAKDEVKDESKLEVEQMHKSRFKSIDDEILCSYRGDFLKHEAI